MTHQPRRHRISSLHWLLRHSAGQSVPGSCREERGIALLLALLIRQLMARKLGASESYQQLAETGAVNGFNRILGRLNNNSPGDYLGFLYAVNNREKAGEPGIPAPGYQWNLFATDAPPVLPQLCTNTSALLSNGAIPPTVSKEVRSRHHMSMTGQPLKQRCVLLSGNGYLHRGNWNPSTSQCDSS